MMIYRNGIVVVAALGCLLGPPEPCRAINPTNGEAIRQANGWPTTPAGDGLVANHFLTDANVGILGPGLAVVGGTPDITTQEDEQLPLGEPRVIHASGTFTNGLAGGQVLARNGNPVQTVGGIGIDKGVCLSTGRVQDLVINTVRVGDGVEGPNDAFPEDGGAPNWDPATASKQFLIDEAEIQNWIGNDDFGDPDLAADANIPIQMTQDRCALEFEVTTTQPGYIQLTVVFASDEFPEWLEPDDPDNVFNDTFGVFIHPVGNENAKVNIAKFRDAANPQTPMPFSVFDAQSCTQLVKFNQSLPPIEEIPTNDHYNHEYDLFTGKMMFESPTVLGPGQYRIKIVIHDVGEFEGDPDDVVDSAIFIEAGSLKLNTVPLIIGDYNGNGEVEQGDLDLVSLNWGQPAVPPPAGWVNDLPSGTIDQDELDRVSLNWGNEEWRADFDRDGDVDGDDLIVWQLHTGLTSCATRTMGDANDDGAVNTADEEIWEEEFGGGTSGTFEWLLLEAASYCQYPPIPVPGPGPEPGGPIPGPVAPPPAPAPAPDPSSGTDSEPASTVDGPSSAPADATYAAPSEATAQNAAESSGATEQQASQVEAAQTQPTYVGPSAQPSARAVGHERYAAIRELTAIAYTEWNEGDKSFAVELWKSVGRVYGEYVLHDSVLELVAE